MLGQRPNDDPPAMLEGLLDFLCFASSTVLSLRNGPQGRNSRHGEEYE